MIGRSYLSHCTKNPANDAGLLYLMQHLVFQLVHGRDICRTLRLRNQCSSNLLRLIHAAIKQEAQLGSNTPRQTLCHKGTNTAFSFFKSSGSILLLTLSCSIEHIAHAAIKAYLATGNGHHCQARIRNLKQQNACDGLLGLGIQLAAR